CKDLVRLIQDQRKEMDLAYTDRIQIGVSTDSEELTAAFTENRDYIAGETLGDSIQLQAIDGVEPQACEIGEFAAQLYVKKV
ncbi:MAG: DUF5915 domain-containing protein, partial [Blastopirellula sp. JB062]